MADCSVNSSLDFDTDHRVIITSLDTPKTKAARRQKKRNVVVLVKKLNTDKLHEKETTKLFIDAVENKLRDFDPQSAITDSTSLSDDITQALNNSASSVLPIVSNIDRSSEIWKDDNTLNDLLKQRDAFSRRTRE